MNLTCTRINFGQSAEYFDTGRNRNTFYRMSQEQKLNVIYDMLRDVRMD